MEPMRRASCRGEARLWRLVSQSVASLGNRCGVMMVFAYLILCFMIILVIMFNYVVYCMTPCLYGLVSVGEQSIQVSCFLEANKSP